MKKLASYAAGSPFPFVVLSLLLGCGDSPFASRVQGSGAPTGNIECEEAVVQSFFADSCAAGLGDMLSCWMASGQCNATFRATGFDIVFDSGAVLEHTNSSDGLSLRARYINPNGEQCGTFETSGGVTSGSGRVTYNTRSGEQFVLQEGDNGYDIVCSNGESLALTNDVQEMFQNCSGGEAAAICTRPGNIDIGGDIGDVVDAIGKPCTSNSECPSGGGVELTCCNFFGDQICYEKNICSAF